MGGENDLIKQHVRSKMKRGALNPNPRSDFLKYIGQFIKKWRDEDKLQNVILMTDMNEDIRGGGRGGLKKCCVDHW